MAKIKVTTNFKILSLLDNFIPGAAVNAIGARVVKLAKESIARGVSPVRSEGRFARYKNPKSYPSKALRKEYSKGVRPVNLKLSGELLDNYGYRVKPGGSIEFGVVSGGLDLKKRAVYVNEGTPSMEARPFIPLPGDEWSVTIMRAIRDLYGDAIKKRIAESNKK